jgi:hypothetical protein
MRHAVRAEARITSAGTSCASYALIARAFAEADRRLSQLGHPRYHLPVVAIPQTRRA